MSTSSEPRPTDALPMVAGWFGPWHIEYVETLGSTNERAAELAEDHRVVVTNHQVAGRGRLDRVWETPAGEALTFSLVVDPGLPDPQWTWVPLLSGWVVASVLTEVCGVDSRLKWPNDVLIGEEKVGGILVERIHTESGPLAVIGIGINVHQSTLPVAAATSLALQGATPDRADVLKAILTRLQALWPAFASDAAQYRRAYRDSCATIGQQVRVFLPSGQTATGRAAAVDDRGCLVVESCSGGLTVSAGDVVHVRAAG